MKYIAVQICVAVLLQLCHVASSQAAFSSIAFFYDKNPPIDELKGFDLAVVDPDQAGDPSEMTSPRSRPIAYVSIGEADPLRGYTRDIKPEWLAGLNRTWGTRIIDQSNPDWQRFILDEIFEPLWRKGYKGFFLDTMDSYRLASPPSEYGRQEAGLVAIITALKKRHPDAVILMNRGFEILPQLSGMIEAVAAESLFQSWDESGKRYGAVSEEDRTWLAGQLSRVKEYGATPVAIDYLPPGNREKMRETAQKIMALGFVPWVTDKYLGSLGVSTVEVMPRKILGIYDGSEADDPVFTMLHRVAELPLNYLGYMLEMHDLREPLPEPVPGVYAGILVWANSYSSGVAGNLDQWLLDRIKEGVHVVFMDNFGFPPTREKLAPFGLEASPAPLYPSKIRIVSQDPAIGYETQPLPVMNVFTPLKAPLASPLLTIENGSGLSSDAVAITAWGGYALFPFTVAKLPNQQSRWVVDPFIFFRKAFRFPEMPVPDPTTENGRRLMLVHMDGDGFIEPAQWGKREFAGEVAFNEIFSRFKIPTTVSIIQGEIAADGLYPQLSGKLEPIARKIFALPWVEIASHSYSHPFNWGKAESMQTGVNYGLAIPGYQFSLDAEIQGSAAYINKTLAPPGKTCRMFLWTGNCLPTEKALAMIGDINLSGMNGGDTTITESQKSITNVAPLGIRRNKQFQVYAPNQNENVYTKLWTGTFYGYERVIETFRLTDAPLRLKPINIYYHFYSASRQASLHALQKVYSWAVQQKPFNLFASEYVEKVHDFNRTVIAKEGNGWKVRNAGQLREFRLPGSAGFPDLEKSLNVAGFSDHENQRYLHVGPGGEATIVMTPEPPPFPYLLSANARLDGYERNAAGIKLQLKGHLPVSLTLGGLSGYSVTGSGNLQEAKPGKPGERLFHSSHTGETVVITVK